MFRATQQTYSVLTGTFLVCERGSIVELSRCSINKSMLTFFVCERGSIVELSRCSMNKSNVNCTTDKQVTSLLNLMRDHSDIQGKNATASEEPASSWVQHNTANVYGITFLIMVELSNSKLFIEVLTLLDKVNRNKKKAIRRWCMYISTAVSEQVCGVDHHLANQLQCSWWHNHYPNNRVIEPAKPSSGTLT